ncbi:hypothetical protein [Fimbriiglobus ruber]|uniref:Uncharacterized protein n=1 Tax=Fimbriiglobus ruber TaxID=1908690 RepID=A0A225DVV6_9BACT|nr:hypothetical protein [Fimbriiglobus ruber]OWK40327.1 hypothetical protein FRUB_05246 [Fimbriiglobus ruber]
MPHLFLAMLLGTTCAAPAETEPIDGNMLLLPAPDGWVMLPDGVTLIVSQAEKGELVYFDTVAEQETKRVSVDFKPGAMTLQGETLYVGTKGASIVHVLDAKTGKEKREITLGGDAVANLACHPSKGPVYASTTTLGVYSIDPASGTATKTAATGHFLVVDPVGGTAVFTGVQPPRGQDEVIVKQLPERTYKVFWDRWGTRAFVLKFVPEGKDLKLVSSQKNAAVNAYTLAISPDGKKVLMTSGGGWRPPVEGGSGGGYGFPAFSTENLETMLGQGPGATNLAFHPVLNMGVANQSGRNIQLFNPKSLIGGKTFSVSAGADGRPLLITFGAKGTKVVLWNGDNPKNPEEGLHFLPLPLTADDRAALEKVYGKLPDPVAVAAKTPRPDKPAPRVPTPGRPGTPAPRVPGPATPGIPVPGATEQAETIELPAGVIAQAGFNAAKGLNSNAKSPPYPLGKSNTPGGAGERGWKGVWPANPKATFVSEGAGEGDGALHLAATTNYNRALAKPLKDSFVIETLVRCPPGGGVKCYVWGATSHVSTGPMWGVTGGKFTAMNGKGNGNGDNQAIKECKPDEWHKVSIAVDVPKQQWTITIDGTRDPKSYGFRYKTGFIQGINFLVEGKEEIYLDAVRFLNSPEK